MIRNGNWICPHDAYGTVISKPPLLAWLAAVSTLPFGVLNQFSLYIPSALALIGIALLLLREGRERFGWRAGLWAALAYLLCPLADRHLTTARYDVLFAFGVTWGAFSAFRAWERGKGWTEFWLAATFATMAKGPLALPLAASGLAAAYWESLSAQPWRVKGSHLSGVLVFLSVTGGWFGLAYWQEGQVLVHRMIGGELMGHAMGKGSVAIGTGVLRTLRTFFSNFLPWSLLLFPAGWRILRHPAQDPNERRFERFVFCWFAASILIFSLGAHQRFRLLHPVLPPSALLAGREAARLTRRLRPGRFLGFIAGLSGTALLALFVYHHILLGDSRSVRETVAGRHIAASIRSMVDSGTPVFFAPATPFAVQFYLNRSDQEVSHEKAVEILRTDETAILVTMDVAKLLEIAGPEGLPLRMLAEAEIPEEGTLRAVQSQKQESNSLS
ncbi:MAG: glycosyltransferase family 39 protein [bacterium]